MNLFSLFRLSFALLILTACGTSQINQTTPSIPATITVNIRDTQATPSIIHMPKLPTSTNVNRPTTTNIQPTKTAIATPVASNIPSTPLHSTDEREQVLIAMINQIRADHGLAPYQAHPDLMQAARAHSCDLAQHQIISHQSSDGRTLAERLAFSSIAWQWPSENIAAGSDDPAFIVAMWMDEPPEGWHRRNILDEQQQEIGVGYCFTPEDATGNRHYWTADFTRR